MKLLHMRICNFKGMQRLDIYFNGVDTNLYGGNGTGKTTVYDAFLWLLFDRDSTNRKEFAVIPRDRAGRLKHHLVTEVEGRISHSGREVTLRKTYAEKWTKRRGDAGRTLAGHETACFVDGLPCTKGEYTMRIAEMMDEETFRLMTHPGYFNTTLSWQERRRRLHVLSGLQEPDETLAIISPAFRHLSAILRDRTTEDALKAARFSARKLRDELEMLPVRMDEASRSALQTEDWSALEAERLLCGQEMDELEMKLSDAREMARREAERLCRMEEMRRRMDLREEALRGAAQEAAARATACRGGAKRLMDTREAALAEEKQLLTLVSGARKQEQILHGVLEREQNEPYSEPDDSLLCGTCGQTLPEKMALEALAVRRAAFESRKTHRIAAVEEDMKLAARRAAALEKQAEEAGQRAEDCRKKADGMEAEAAEWERRKNNQAAPNLMADAEYTRMAAALAEAEREAPCLVADISPLMSRRRELGEILFGIQKKLAGCKQAEAARRRLDELSLERENLVARVAAQEDVIADLERFSVYKSSLLEERVNMLFTAVRWRLSEKLLNGGVADCCECLVDGVPYADANSASKMNAGLEIIDVIGRAAGISAPVFIDNRESVNRLYPLQAQVIGLFVTEEKMLRVECAQNEKKPA